MVFLLLIFKAKIALLSYVLYSAALFFHLIVYDERLPKSANKKLRPNSRVVPLMSVS